MYYNRAYSKNVCIIVGKLLLKFGALPFKEVTSGKWVLENFHLKASPTEGCWRSFGEKIRRTNKYTEKYERKSDSRKGLIRKKQSWLRLQSLSRLFVDKNHRRNFWDKISEDEPDWNARSSFSWTLDGILLRAVSKCIATVCITI